MVKCYLVKKNITKIQIKIGHSASIELTPTVRVAFWKKRHLVQKGIVVVIKAQIKYAELIVCNKSAKLKKVLKTLVYDVT